MKNRVFVIFSIIIILTLALSSVVFAANDQEKNYDIENTDKQSSNEYKNMIRIMRDNGFKDAAKYMKTNDQEKMNEYMESMSQEDFERMVEAMNKNGYESMAEMMSSIGREGMIKMHRSMGSMHGGNGMMNGLN